MNPHNATRTKLPRLSIVFATAVALLATGSAYQAMVLFGMDLLDMDAGTAMALTGVFELSLITVAILAREAARDNRPSAVLLTLTWVLSAASGILAAWHEILGDGTTPELIGAAVFRLLVPLVAALMWHLALIGDRHLAAGVSWASMRIRVHMRRYYEAVEASLRASDSGKGIGRARRRLIRATSAARAAVPPEQMPEVTRVFAASNLAMVDMAEAARAGHDRLRAAVAPTTQRNATRNENQARNETPRNGNAIELNGTPIHATETERAVTNVRPIPVAILNATDNATQPDAVTSLATEPATETVKPTTSNATKSASAPRRNATEPKASTSKAPMTKACIECGTTFQAKTKRAQYCGSTCRSNRYKRNHATERNAVPAFA